MRFLKLHSVKNGNEITVNIDCLILYSPNPNDPSQSYVVLKEYEEPMFVTESAEMIDRVTNPTIVVRPT